MSHGTLCQNHSEQMGIAHQPRSKPSTAQPTACVLQINQYRCGRRSENHLFLSNGFAKSSLDHWNFEALDSNLRAD